MNKRVLQKDIKRDFDVDTGPRMSRTQLKEWIESRPQIPQVGTYLPGEIRAVDKYPTIKARPILKRQNNDRVNFINRNMSDLPPFTISNGNESNDDEEVILEVYDDEDLLEGNNDENDDLDEDNNNDEDLEEDEVATNNDEDLGSNNDEEEEEEVVTNNNDVNNNDQEETEEEVVTNNDLGSNNDEEVIVKKEETKVNNNNNNDLGDVEVFELAGYIDKVQSGAQRSKRVNIHATFQPKDKPIQPPTIPKARARIVGLGRPTISGNQGIALQPTKEAQQRTFEMSRPGHRVDLSKPKEAPVTVASLKTQTSDIDVRKLQNGTYTVDQLKSFLRGLGLHVSGTKAVLIGRLLEAVGKKQ